MKKLAAATIFAAVALAAQSAAACDWNREASTEQQQIAATAAPTQTQPAASTTTQAPTVAAETSKPVEPTAPVVLVNDRH
jgi:hypothetical protein